MNDLLVVYNTCGISGRDNVLDYAASLHSILMQRTQAKLRTVISSCLNPALQRRYLQKVFGENVSHHNIDHHMTVNMTFNLTARKAVREFGPFAGYLYLDSGCVFTEDTDIQKMWTAFKSGHYGMVLGPTDTDTAFEQVLGFDYPTEDYEVPLGKGLNLHCQIFSHELYEAFGRRLMPDVFAGFCTESTFTFMNAAIKKKMLIKHDLRVRHAQSMDGASSGFPHNSHWDYLIQGARPMREVVADAECDACGMGYEICRGVKPFNPNAYNEDGTPKDPERLRRFINDNFFLPNHVIDYDKVPTEFIK